MFCLHLKYFPGHPVYRAFSKEVVQIVLVNLQLNRIRLHKNDLSKMSTPYQTTFNSFNFSQIWNRRYKLKTKRDIIVKFYRNFLLMHVQFLNQILLRSFSCKRVLFRCRFTGNICATSFENVLYMVILPYKNPFKEGVKSFFFSETLELNKQILPKK